MASTVLPGGRLESKHRVENANKAVTDERGPDGARVVWKR